MPVNGMNVGTDYSLAFYDGATGTIVDMGDVQDVKIQALKHDIKTMPYNDFPRYGFVPDGYKVDFTITRSGPTLEDFMVKSEANFNAGAVQKPGFLNESITNPDGSVSRYQYSNFVIFLDNHGNISRDKATTLTLTGMASTKIQIA
ncbi:hypothetical protein HAP48_0042430 [Bradyrhizobium septentrionale]|uniref:Uncharacterized protein n=1 Tax=Bradyrhizobium septentrionale TaxID=1404411 RepID=A0A973W2J8_9BRAD|nr:hypothetical protein [Bradyrhizobium septentrionale]UGY15116.1 hypothetical protein HAP48_0042430 [Bradyrhizobium septentrionale]UGY23721.1 hypothetical protein HU675_0038210 [Bradyrhizobium septentrionale]